MRQQDESGLSRLSDEILSYLRAHPQAADTVDGIIQWWLPRQRQEEAGIRVQYTLDALVVRGLVKKITLVDGTVLYADRRHSLLSPQWAKQPIQRTDDISESGGQHAERCDYRNT